MKDNYPIAIIDIKGSEFVGKTEALVIEDLQVDLITGPNLYTSELGKRHPHDAEVKEIIEMNDVTGSSKNVPGVKITPLRVRPIIRRK